MGTAVLFLYCRYPFNLHVIKFDGLDHLIVLLGKTVGTVSPFFSCLYM